MSKHKAVTPFFEDPTQTVLNPHLVGQQRPPDVETSTGKKWSKEENYSFWKQQQVTLSAVGVTRDETAVKRMMRRSKPEPYKSQGRIDLVKLNQVAKEKAVAKVRAKASTSSPARSSGGAGGAGASSDGRSESDSESSDDSDRRSHKHRHGQAVRAKDEKLSIERVEQLIVELRDRPTRLQALTVLDASQMRFSVMNATKVHHRVLKLCKDVDPSISTMAKGLVSRWRALPQKE